MRAGRCGAWARGVRWLGFLACLLVQGPVRAEGVDLAQARVCASPAAAPCSLHDVPLPFYWDALHPGSAGTAEIVIAFTLPRPTEGPQAIYLSRIGNGYEISLNGGLVERSEGWNTPNGPDFAKQPRLIGLPAALLAERNELRIRLRADVGRRAGLARPVLGPRDELSARFQRDYRWRVLGSVLAAALSLSVAVLALALWASQRRQSMAVDVSPQRDPAYLYAAIAQAGWAVFLADPVIDVPVTGWPWWGLVLAAGFAAGVCAMTLFCQHLVGLDTRRSGWLMGVVAGTGLVAAALGFWGGTTLMWTLWISGIVVCYTVYGFYFAWACRREPSVGKWLLSAAVLTNVLGGLWDWVDVVRNGDLYGDFALGRFLPILYGVVLGYIMVSRFRDASLRADMLAASMAEQISAKTQELQQTYQRMEQLAREQARAAERTRILRDMHDGVGSHISSAIRQLQSGRVDHAEVLLTLRDSLDQLKLSIDSMSMSPGDVTALLANMRYRLGPRFAASDIELEWDVDLLAPVPRFDADAMRQLQFMVFEALSNVLQHSHASVVRIRACDTAEGVQLSIADDGCGFDASQPPRKGLSSMVARAAAIGARVLLRSAPGSTAVEIVIVEAGRLKPAA